MLSESSVKGNLETTVMRQQNTETNDTSQESDQIKQRQHQLKTTSTEHKKTYGPLKNRVLEDLIVLEVLVPHTKIRVSVRTDPLGFIYRDSFRRGGEKLGDEVLVC